MVVAAGYDLEDLSVTRAGRRYVVRVIVDGDGGVSLDAVADVSRAVSKALDAAEERGGELISGEYQLEVSSPGVHRPLTLPRHWRRNVGRLVKVTVTGSGRRPPEQRRPVGAPDATGVPEHAPDDTGAAEPDAGDRPAPSRQVTGRVLAADDDTVVLETEAGPTEWRYAELGPGRVQVEFGRLDEIADDELLAGDEEYDVDDGDDEDVEGEER